MSNIRSKANIADEPIEEPVELQPNELLPDKIAEATLIRVASLQHDVCHVRKEQKRTSRTIFGNGADGMLIEVDRLKGSEERRRWLEKKAIGTLVAIVVTALVAVTTIHIAKSDEAGNKVRAAPTVKSLTERGVTR